jgi:TolB-like protein
LRLVFHDFALDGKRRELRRSGALVALEPKVFDLLAYLIDHRDRVISRDELISVVWDGRIISESALASCINAARAAVGDSGGEQRLIKTLPRKGIRFVGSVREDDAASRASAEASALEAGQTLVVADRPSIAVLPFHNISSDPEQEYFVDGVVGDIISDLSRIKWLFVTARNSSFVYKGKAVDVKQVARELGVRYILEGSVRKVADRVRIAAELIEAQTGVHLWAERYDRRYDDIFALQDELTLSVIGAIEPNLRKFEIERVRRKRPESLDAYDLALQALPYTYSHRAEDADHAIPLLTRALEIEPGYPAAHASLAWCYHFLFRLGLRPEDRDAAIRHAHAAIADGDDATALGIAGFVISMDERDYATGLDLFERALSLSGSNIFALSCSALILAFGGKIDLAIERAERALRLSPFNYLSNNALVVAHLVNRRHEEAHEAARRSVQLNPQFSVCRAFLAAALIGIGHVDQANAEAQRVLTLEPTFTIKRFLTVAGFAPDVFAVLSKAWQKAGLPMD